MTAPAYTPSKPGDSAVLERLARQAQEGVSMDDARELVLRAYMAGFAAGVGEYVSDRTPAEPSTEEPERTLTVVERDAVRPPRPTAQDSCLNCGKPIYLIALRDGTQRWTHAPIGRRITRCGDEKPSHVEHYDATVEGPEQHGPASVHRDGSGATVQIDCYCDRVFTGSTPVGDFEAHLATAGLDERVRSDAALVVGDMDAKAREAAEL